MLWFERQVVESLLEEDDPHRDAVIRYVEESLAVMPEPIRAGVVAETLLLGGWPAVRHHFGRLDRSDVRTLVGRWEHSPVGLVRQYVRVLHSLTLFAQCELAPNG